MLGPQITIGVIFALALFTIFVIIKSEDGWKGILPIIFLSALASIFMVVSMVLIMLVPLKILFDLIKVINDAYNPPEGMFFHIKNSVCMYINTLS